MVPVTLSGSISQGELVELHAYCRKTFGDDLEVRPEPKSFGIELDAAGAISGVVACIVAVISLCYQIIQRGGKTNWSLARLSEEVSTECARRGLPEVKITSLINFDALLNSSREPCKLKAATPEGVEIEMYVFSDGTKYAIEVR